jgi:hypothetical protein
MEEMTHCTSLDAARNEAIKWLERKGAVFGPHRDIQIGQLGVMAGSETGVYSTAGPYWRIRLDFDTTKGAHYNVEYGKGAQRAKHAFAFPASEEMMARIAGRREPRG